MTIAALLGENTSIELLAKIGEVVVEPRCERATIEENVAAFCTGLIGKIDLSVGSAPVILLGKSSRHLSRNALQPTEAAFQVAQHLPMDVVSSIPNDDTGELVVYRDIEDTSHLHSRE